MFASTSQSRINNLHISLTNAQKGNESAGVYFGLMRALADELAMAGDPITGGQLLSFIIVGLDMDYQPIISALDVCRPRATLCR
ncbi:retrotransposon protein, putative, Ty1-copia subclass [Hordeum vulgare]|nr:retrotransposon protein, putative, Ty1-copia subclass [Hordeum vulgare]